MAFHHTIAPQLPDPGDAERNRLIESGDAYAWQNYPKVIKAITDGAKSKDKTCLELYMKYIAHPEKEARAERKADQPSSPPSMSVRIAQARISFNVLGAKGRPPIQITSAEFNELPADRQSDLKTNYDIQFIEPQLLSAGPSTAENEPATVTPSTVAGSPAEPNKECAECGQGFYSNQPAAKYCADCRKAREMRKLAEHKRAHGKKLSPAMSAMLEPETNGALGELTHD